MLVFVVGVIATCVLLQPRAALAQSGETAPGSSLGLSSGTSIHDLVHTLIQAFGGGRPFNTDAEIDRLVGRGDPWNLLPSTSLKLVTLGPRLRFRIFGLLADRLPSSTLTPMDGRSDAGATGWVYQTNAAGGLQFINPILDTVVTHFTDVQLVDLITATAFRLPILPRTPYGWRSLKRWIDRFDIPIILALALIGALSNQGVLQLGGQFTRLNHETASIGWYLGTQQLGVLANPILRGGLTVLNTTTQIFVGVVGQLNAPREGENFGFELFAKQHWIQTFRRSLGLEFSFTERGRYVLSRNDPTGPAFISDLDLYARRPGILGSADFNLLLNTRLGSDFLSRFQITHAIGLEEVRHDMTLVFQLTTNSDLRGGEPSYRAGFFGGGSLESRMTHAGQESFRYARRIHELLESIAIGQARINDGQEFFSRPGPRMYHGADDVARRALQRQRAAVLLRRGELARVLAAYLETRRAYYEYTARAPDTITDEDGTLEPEVLAAARIEAVAARP